jgi:hypothetical protein
MWVWSPWGKRPLCIGRWDVLMKEVQYKSFHYPLGPGNLDNNSVNSQDRTPNQCPVFDSVKGKHKREALAVSYIGLFCRLP